MFTGSKSSRDLFIINADGSGLKALPNTPDLEERDPDWSPAGDQIVFYAAPAGSDLEAWDIWVINADGTGLQRLTESPGVCDASPTWSPDGTQIAWDRFDLDADDSNIFIMDADGSDPVRLPDEPLGINFNPAWSPDGTKIAFASTRDHSVEIYLLDVAQAAAGHWGREVNLTNDPAEDNYPSWSADGSKIVFFSRRDPSGGYVMNADGTGVELIYDGLLFRFPDWRAAPAP